MILYQVCNYLTSKSCNITNENVIPGVPSYNRGGYSAANGSVSTGLAAQTESSVRGKLPAEKHQCSVISITYLSRLKI